MYSTTKTQKTQNIKIKTLKNKIRTFEKISTEEPTRKPPSGHLNIHASLSKSRQPPLTPSNYQNCHQKKKIVKVATTVGDGCYNCWLATYWYMKMNELRVRICFPSIFQQIQKALASLIHANDKIRR